MTRIKKYSLLIILIMMTGFFVNSIAHADFEQRFFDKQGYYDLEEQAEINETILAAEGYTNFIVAVVITDNIGTNKSDSAAEKYIEDFYLAQFGEFTNGVILLVNNDPDSLWNHINAEGECAAIFTSYRIDSIFDSIIDYKINGDIASFIDGFCDEVIYYAGLGAVEGYVPNRSQFINEESSGIDIGAMIIVFLIVDIIIILIFVFAIKAAYKIKPVKCAHSYLNQESVSYRQKSDTYIRTHVTKVRIQSNSSSGGGSGKSGGFSSGSSGGRSGGGRRG
jgi:uncharacterized protein